MALQSIFSSSSFTAASINEYVLRCDFFEIHDFFTLLPLAVAVAAAEAAAVAAAVGAVENTDDGIPHFSTFGSESLLSLSALSQFCCRDKRDINFIHSVSSSGVVGVPEADIIDVIVRSMM
jgi:hypothetical protein